MWGKASSGEHTGGARIHRTNRARAKSCARAFGDGGQRERHEIPLPEGFWPARMLAVDRGFLLAGPIRTERTAVVWIPMAGER